MLSTKKICRSGQNMLFTHKYERGWIWIWLYLSSSAWGIQLHYNLFWKRIDPKNFLFTETNNWIALAVRWSIKYFFAPNSTIFWIRLAEKQKEEEHSQLQSVMHFTQMQYLLAFITLSLNGIIFHVMALKGPAWYVCLWKFDQGHLKNNNNKGQGWRGQC